MTVRDLIVKLLEVPMDTIVLVSGYEGGYELVDEVEIGVRAVHNGYEIAYEGPYRLMKPDDPIDAAHAAVILS